MALSDIQRYSAFKPAMRIAAAAVIAGLIVFATSTAPKAAAPDISQISPASAAKSDRQILAIKGAACSQHGWPDFEQTCQFDTRTAVGDARTVRIIALR
jgi:hypothetical protein